MRACLCRGATSSRQLQMTLAAGAIGIHAVRRARSSRVPARRAKWHSLSVSIERAPGPPPASLSESLAARRATTGSQRSRFDSDPTPQDFEKSQKIGWVGVRGRRRRPAGTPRARETASKRMGLRRRGSLMVSSGPGVTSQAGHPPRSSSAAPHSGCLKSQRSGAPVAVGPPAARGPPATARDGTWSARRDGHDRDPPRAAPAAAA
jgi:hypothetical protein